MKKIFVCSLLLVLGIGFIFAQHTSSDKNEPAAAVITFDKTTHDFGVFSEDDPVVKCTFTFTNEGNAPLVIIFIRFRRGSTDCPAKSDLCSQQGNVTDVLGHWRNATTKPRYRRLG